MTTAFPLELGNVRLKCPAWISCVPVGTACSSSDVLHSELCVVGRLFDRKRLLEMEYPRRDAVWFETGIFRRRTANDDHESLTTSASSVHALTLCGSSMALRRELLQGMILLPAQIHQPPHPSDPSSTAWEHGTSPMASKLQTPLLGYR